MSEGIVQLSEGVYEVEYWTLRGCPNAFKKYVICKMLLQVHIFRAEVCPNGKRKNVKMKNSMPLNDYYCTTTSDRGEEIMKKARCEGEKQRVPKGQIITEAEDVHEDVASERASFGSSTDDDHNVAHTKMSKSLHSPKIV